MALMASFMADEKTRVAAETHLNKASSRANIGNKILFNEKIKRGLLQTTQRNSNS